MKQNKGRGLDDVSAKADTWRKASQVIMGSSPSCYACIFSVHCKTFVKLCLQVEWSIKCFLKPEVTLCCNVLSWTLHLYSCFLFSAVHYFFFNPLSFVPSFLCLCFCSYPHFTYASIISIQFHSLVTAADVLDGNCDTNFNWITRENCLGPEVLP